MEQKLSFREKLMIRQEKIKSLLCIGLDPLPEKMPAHLITPGPYGAHVATDTALWMMKIVDSTAPYASMYKLQRAYWEAIPGGADALRMVITYIERTYPDIPVFTDCKRGDIDRTQACYRVGQFDIDGTEGMNFSPYMGKDCMQYLVDEENKGRGIVGLCYTSNIAAREVQDKIMDDGRPYWEFMAETILRWSEELGITENSGLVMAAAYEFPKKSGNIVFQHLTRVREIVGDKLWLLIPGVGTQGGFIYQTVKAAFMGYGSMAINASSSIIFASKGEDFAEASGEQARLLYVAMADALEIGKFARIHESLIVPGDPLQTLKNCNGYYTAKDKDGNMVGHLVAYNGTYEIGDGNPERKHFVGAEYYDFAYAEKLGVVRNHFAKLIAAKIKEAGLKAPDVFMGAAYGGILLTGSLGDLFPNSEVIFTTKKVTALKTATSKEQSEAVLERHNPRGSSFYLAEDVSNNRTGIDQMIELTKKKGGRVVAIVCAFNRSDETEYKGLPIISACHIPTEQWRQDDPLVSGMVSDDRVEWSPKNNFEELLLDMTDYND